MARRPSGGTRFRRRWSDPGVTKCQHQRAPKRSTARARACAAISSRFLGDVVVVSESINRLAIFHVVDRAVERRLVRLRRRVEPTELPDEPQRSGADLLVSGGRIEIEKSFDISAHI